MTPPTTEHPAAHLRPLEGGAPAMPWLWIGTWSLGGEGVGSHDLGEARALLRAAIDAGIRHFDTAGFYAHGKSEELLGEAIRERRRELFVSTKGGLVWEGRKVRHRARPADLRRALEQSLRRLGTDYVDLFQLHWPDPEVPLAESLGALEELCAEGLARCWGAGNLGAAELRARVPAGARMPHQLPFNPVHRTDELLAAGAEAQRCVSCVVSPFEQGLLADGRGSRGLDDLGKRDARRRNPRFRDPAVLSWVAELQRLTEAPRRAAVVLLWILAQPGAHAVVAGPRLESQLRALLAHVDRMAEAGLAAPNGAHCDSWQRTLEARLGTELWTHLGSLGASSPV